MKLGSRWWNFIVEYKRSMKFEDSTAYDYEIHPRESVEHFKGSADQVRTTWVYVVY